MKYFFLLIIIFTASCDHSFNVESPFSYSETSSYISGLCYSNKDCSPKEICNILLKRCILPPCNNICNQNGVCIEKYDKNNEIIAICTCDSGFQDNNNDKICTPECKETDCLNGYCDTTNYEEATCICNEGYQDSNHDLTCEISCNHKGYNCAKNGICNLNSNGLISCECSENGLDTANGLGCYSDGYFNTFTTSSTTDDDKAYDLVKDSQNNIYFTGEFRDTITLGDNFDSNGKRAGFIVKMNNDTIIWTKILKGSGGVAIKNIIYNDKRLYISGSYSGEIDFNPSNIEEDLRTSGNGTNSFITVLDDNGNYINSLVFNGSSFIANKEIIVKNNNLYILGQFKKEIEFKAKDTVFEHFNTAEITNDLFLAKINKNLEYEWVKQFGDNLTNDYTGGFDIDNNDNIYLTYKFNADSLNDLGESKLVKLNPSGEIIETYTIPKTDYIKSLILKDNLLYILGYNRKEITLMKYNLENKNIKVQTIKSEFDISVTSLKMDPENNIYILGKAKNKIIFSEIPRDIYEDTNHDFMFISKFFYDFTYGYSIVFGIIENTENKNRINPYNIYVDNQDIFVTGSFRGSIISSSIWSEIKDIKESTYGDDLFLWHYKQ